MDDISHPFYSHVYPSMRMCRLWCNVLLRCRRFIRARHLPLLQPFLGRGNEVRPTFWFIPSNFCAGWNYVKNQQPTLGISHPINTFAATGSARFRDPFAHECNGETRRGTCAVPLISWLDTLSGELICNRCATTSLQKDEVYIFFERRRTASG